MWRKAFLAMAALALLAAPGASSAWAAAAPFGFFGGLARGGNAGNGVEPVQGWALAGNGVFAVDIVVDGAIIGRANYGRSRPRVTKQFPGFPDSALPGFGFQLDTTHFLNGMHTVSARVTSRTGEVAYLNSLQLQFTNTTHDLLPFGKIEFPNEGAELPGSCDLSDPRRLVINDVIAGYALDVNTEHNAPGVAYAELLIDGALWFNSQFDCSFIAAAGGLSNCYGLRRPDLEQVFPGLKDAPHAGFRFVLDVGSLIGTTDSFGIPLFTPGSHQLSIRVGDQFEQVTEIASVAVDFVCREDNANDPSIGQIELPIPGLLYGGTILVSGWAVDLQCVAAVLVYVDGNLVQFATLNQPRPDIVSLYPSYVGNTCTTQPGWFTFIDTTQLSNGVHELSAVVFDTTGATTFIGKRPFTVDNPIP
jgi:hypothetical protein